MKFTGEKTEAVKKLYNDMLEILAVVGIPMEGLSDRRKEKMAGACLATGQIITSLKEAKSVMNGVFLKTRDIIDFENTHYGENISSGVIRRYPPQRLEDAHRGKTGHQLVGIRPIGYQ